MESELRGLERALQKAASEPEFKRALVERRVEAAREVGIELTDAEAHVLHVSPAHYLERVIDRIAQNPDRAEHLVQNVFGAKVSPPREIHQPGREVPVMTGSRPDPFSLRFPPGLRLLLLMLVVLGLPLLFAVAILLLDYYTR